MTAPSAFTPFWQFLNQLEYHAIPESVIVAARRHLLDLVGVAAVGSTTELARIITAHAVSEFGGGGSSSARLMFDGRVVSASGAALAGGMAIDSIDAHDGHRLTKGHVGCGLLPALLAALELRRQRGARLSDQEFLTVLIIGYEIGTRAGIALHGTAADYHTSGAWVSIAAAAVMARVLELDVATTREAVGIAEYHGPRSPMMRCIDHPTMLKDGSGWGAMAGVSAALLARDGFTGAPAVTVENPEMADLWNSLGSHWYMADQYIKLYPVCRWAQPAVAAALILRAEHGIDPTSIGHVAIRTFREAARLNARIPQNTEQAQYSLPFPVACALVRGCVGVREVAGDGLEDPAIRALSKSMTVSEHAEYSGRFPGERVSDLTITLRGGEVLESGPTLALGDPETPIDAQALSAKFHALATPVLGKARSASLHDLISQLGLGVCMESLELLIYPPP